MSEPAEPTDAISPEHENIDRFFQLAKRAVAQASTMHVRGRVLQIVGTVKRVCDCCAVGSDDFAGPTFAVTGSVLWL
ncbi:hypothetical protein BPNPMPFG_006500 (plasmid) [Mesorhizobium sp. AR07]|uniref:hypothetical protein n=1 Tax=Mesorhizobium sp. AR07 TaxID=2865838 RepID=UPI001615EB49|nr:hypothetical protein [Mesorhizobium sp. AR07]QND69411.1 hypothetical protein HB777_37625 [Mesorhizobium loti]UVK48901.1 hypothetical protein BPNPMPFG_006500 [Mesorhizobium sp. AR07]